MGRALILLSLSALPVAAQQYKIAVVSMLHAHVWLHLGDMLKGDNAKLVGIAETRPELLQRAKRTDRIPQSTNTRPGVPENLFFADWKKMIDETKPDIVWAFTPTNEHVDVVRYCAPRGIHVIMEKPLAASYQQALEIQSLAKKYNILALANYGSTWQASNYAVKAAVDAGEIGPVWRLHAVQGSGGPGDPKTSSFVAWLADPVQNGGGALIDFGCYIVNWSLWLKGMPESVYATALHLKPQLYPNVEDDATVTLNYKDGVAILEASWDLPPAPRPGNEVYGLTGSIVGGVIRKAGQHSPQPAAATQPGLRAQPPGDPLTVNPLPPERSEPIAYMVDRIRHKQPLDGPSALDLNVDVQEVLEAAKISIKTGQAVPLPLEPQR
ncbi:MAG: Gfo/Idh/MocA family oxidoreductase [Acidobacteriia bacterium]|nr:Gfo/Idh/MocA family oxidoreductase [Terriglobia bacterium]